MPVVHTEHIPRLVPVDSAPLFLWVAAPTTRGTFQIISLCLSTMFICVWNALHMDIPTYRLSTGASVGQGVVWMLSTLLFPELLLLAALVQWTGAKDLMKNASRLGFLTTLEGKRDDGTAHDQEVCHSMLIP